MSDDSGSHPHRSGNRTSREVAENANAPPLTAEEFEALLRTASENDTKTRAPAKTWELFDIICLAAPALGVLTMLVWIWLSRQFD